MFSRPPWLLDTGGCCPERALPGNCRALPPPPAPNAGFTWDKLGEFDYSSNLHDFVEAVGAGQGNGTLPHTAQQLHAVADAAATSFCTPEA